MFSGDVIALAAGLTVFLWFARRFRQRQRELVGRERARIAQDLHDQLGHDLNLIALSAGTLKLTVPDEHRPAAHEVRARAAAAVEHLGEVVGVLRTNDTATLVDGARRAGLEVTLDAELGADGPVARRVVQEALTNAVKHAPGAPVAVRVRRHANRTEVSVTNGLPGLTERVEAAGGALAYGVDGGGFHVTARVPAAPPPARNEPRLGRLACAAVAVPLAVAALIGVGTRAWEAHLVSATVLDAAAYEALTVGQASAHQDGCERYAITANPLDDSYGDTYQLCFAAGRLVSKQVRAA